MAQSGGFEMHPLEQFELHSIGGALGHSANFTQANLFMVIGGLLVLSLLVLGTRARAIRSGSSVQLSGRNSRRPTITGTSRDANVTETSD